jgi:hypothetical protein
MSGGSVAGALKLAYAVAGGPFAWLAQINLLYPLVATPCFPGAARNLAYPSSAQWAFVLAIAAYFLLLAVAIGSALVARALYRRFAAPDGWTGDHFEGSGAGRSRFLAFCGILLGTGFSAMILLNGPALVMVPPCAI